MTAIFDSHAHYDDASFQEDRDTLLRELPEKGVEAVINVGCDAESSEKSIALASKYTYFYAAVGVHPEMAEEVKGDWISQIEALAYRDKVVAIGEIGLDYHYDTPSREAQKIVFQEQLALAKKLALPVIIHSRNATEDTLSLVKKFSPQGVIHCFTSAKEVAQEYLSLGLYIGFTGAVTFKNARKVKESAAIVPLDRLLLETDCPYMAPEPYRGTRCSSDMIYFTAKAIAEQKGCTAEEVLSHASQNAKKLFSIS